MNIKAIETHYKGYRFRSRLEARWAVFFDALGIRWTYESEGYERDWNGPLRYLPDFVIQVGSGGVDRVFVEVKGNKNELAEKHSEMQDMHDYGGILPGFADSYGSRNWQGGVRAGLLLLGEIPYPQSGVTVFHPLITHCKGLWHQWAMFTISSFAPVCTISNQTSTYDNLIAPLDLPEDRCAHEQFGWIVDHAECRLPRWVPKVREAYQAARSARFEHGEKGG